MQNPSPAEPAKRQIVITTRGLDRLDFFVDGRPQASVDLEPNRLAAPFSIRWSIGARN